MTTLNPNSSSSWLTTLINTGADAMTNLFYVDFKSAAGLEDEYKPMFTMRVDDISGLPNPKHKSETKRFMTVDVDVPVCDFDIDKKLTLKFRLDVNYKVYEKLLKLQSGTFIPSKGLATTVIDALSKTPSGENLFNIDVKVAQNLPTYETAVKDDSDYDGQFKTLYSFNYCWISKISGVESFSYDNSSAMTVTAEIYYYNWRGPYTTIEESNKSSKTTEKKD